MEEPLRRLGMPQKGMTSHTKLVIWMLLIPFHNLIQITVGTGKINYRHIHGNSLEGNGLLTGAGTVGVIEEKVRFHFVSEGKCIGMLGQKLERTLICQIAACTSQSGNGILTQGCGNGILPIGQIALNQNILCSLLTHGYTGNGITSLTGTAFFLKTHHYSGKFFILR